MPSRANENPGAVRESSEADEYSFERCLATVEPRSVDRRQAAKPRPSVDDRSRSDDDSAPGSTDSSDDSSSRNAPFTDAPSDTSPAAAGAVNAPSAANAASSASDARKPEKVAAAKAPVSETAQLPAPSKNSTGLVAKLNLQPADNPTRTEPFSLESTQMLRAEGGPATSAQNGKTGQTGQTGQAGQLNLLSPDSTVEVVEIKSSPTAAPGSVVTSKGAQSETIREATGGPGLFGSEPDGENGAGGQPVAANPAIAGQNSISRPKASGSATGPNGPTAPNAATLGINAVRPESAGPTHRSAATERSTTTSFEAEGKAISVVGQTALEEGNTPGENSRRGNGSTSSSDAERARVLPQLANASADQQSTFKVDGLASQPLDIDERMRLVEQVRKRIDALHVTNGRHEVTLRLHPDHLGEVRLTIVADRGQIAARFLAETAQARQAMTEGREQLRAALEQKGFTLHSLDVEQLSGRESEANRSAQLQPNGSALDFSMNSGHLAGERRFSTHSSGEHGGSRVPVQTEATGRSGVSGLPDSSTTSRRRRADGRLDYQV